MRFNSDISGIKYTLTSELNKLIPNLSSLSYEETMKQVLDILDNPRLHVSPEKMKLYRMNLSNKHTKDHLDFYICSIALNGTRMGVL